MLTIFKGDDTGGTIGKRIAITVTTTIPLTGCTVVFNFCGIERKFTNVTSGSEIEIFFSHNDTRNMSLGIGKATLYLIDSAGKIRTLTNSLPIKVTNNVAECYSADATQTTIYIRTLVTWNDIGGKPFAGQTVNLRNEDEKLAALGTIVEQLGGTVNV